MSGFRTKKQRRDAQARWRERHPILACWHDHVHNAKKRGIEVLWDVEEFARWCRETGYHILRKEGYQIHRERDQGGYAYERCSMVKAEINRHLQDFYRRTRRNDSQ